MPISLTKLELVDLRPCDLDKRMALFGDRVQMDARQALAAGATIQDLLWVAGRLGRKDLCVQFALACAQRAVQYDKSGTAQPCLDAARAYVADESEENLRALRKARYAAADAAAYAAAAYAAYAAADAADAAAAYADADAAAYAAYAAYAAARKAEQDAQREIFLEIFG